MGFSLNLAGTTSILRTPQGRAPAPSALRALLSSGQASPLCCTRPHGLQGCGHKWAIWLLRCVTKKADITNVIISHLIKTTTKTPALIVAVHLCLFGLSGYPLMLLKMKHFMSNCYMPGWFMGFCFSGFHRCLPPYSKLSFSASSQISPSLPCSLPACGSSSSCSHTLLTSIPSTCPASWAKLEWMCLQCRWTGCAPGLCHSCLAIWCEAFCWRGRFKHFSEGRTKFQ